MTLSNLLLRTRLLTAATVLFLLPGAAHAQVDPSCLCIPIPMPYERWAGGDSTKIDTCSVGGADCREAFLRMSFDERNARMYARGPWDIIFEAKVIHLPILPNDSVVLVSWRDIDTNYGALRAAFESIENQLGTFALEKFMPNDTSSRNGRRFAMHFDKDVHVPTAQAALNMLRNTAVDRFSGGFYYYDGAVQSPASRSAALDVRVEGSTLHITAPIDDAGDRNGTIVNIRGEMVQRFRLAEQRAMVYLSALPSGRYFVTVDGCATSIAWFVQR